MRILVVDDEHLIVKVIGRQLQKAGYHPVCLYDSRQAIELFKRNPDFDLAILDICMPVITGIEMADEIRKIKPILPIILMTGMLENVTVEDASNIKNVLYKPIPRDRLLDTVRKSLYL